MRLLVARPSSPSAGCSWPAATASASPPSTRATSATCCSRSRGAGIVVSQPVVGQTACDDPDLVANSLYLTARLPDEHEPATSTCTATARSRGQASQAEVDACQAIYAASHPGARIVRLDIPTFRVFGADWSPELTRELRAAIEEAAQARVTASVMRESPAHQQPPEPALQGRAGTARCPRAPRTQGACSSMAAARSGEPWMPTGGASRPGSLPTACEARRPGRSCPACGQPGPSCCTTTPRCWPRWPTVSATMASSSWPRSPPPTSSGCALPERPLVAVVEQVEKPGNLGALLRSADGAGVDAVIVADAALRPLEPQCHPRQPGHHLQPAPGRLHVHGGPRLAAPAGHRHGHGAGGRHGRLRRRGPLGEASPSSSARRPRAWARPGRART